MAGILQKFERERSGEVYRSLVQSLYQDTKVLIVAIIGMSIAIGITAHAAGSGWLWALSVAFLVVGAARVMLNRAFHKAKNSGELSDADARFWQKGFSIGVGTHALMSGIWVFVSCLSGSPVAEITSIAVTFGALIGLCCRSYPFKSLVTMQLLLVFVPVWAGLSFLGGYFSVLGLLLIPLMTSTGKIAGDLRAVLLENIFQRRNAEKNAKRLDNALNSLPHGVCVFDIDGYLEVTNHHVATSTGKSEEQLIGLTVPELVTLFSNQMSIEERDTAILLHWANRRMGADLLHTMEVGDDRKRTMKCRAKNTGGRGTIVTIEDITKEVRAAQAAEHLRKYDLLTGLFNRPYFTSQLDEELTSGPSNTQAAMLLVSLDRFKKINDSLGNRIGDLLLQRAASRVKRVCGSAGKIARYGGNEFGIALHGADACSLSDMMADTLTSVLSQPFEVEGRVVHLGASVGIAKYENGDDTISSLLDRAGLALLSAKQKGGEQWALYNDEMGCAAENRRKLENDLREALRRNQFEAYFQPLISVKGLKISTCEALLRWKHPALGFVSPARFIPIAEEIGEISKIGAWMLLESCRACQTWPEQTRVAVNLSPLQFNEGNIIEVVREALLQSGLAPNRLELEITESLMLDDIEDTIEKLEQFKKMGVRISLDDFGTGYSCLSYLNRLPLDKVKIDRSFVHKIHENPKSLTLVQAISGLGQQLGLSVVVEGVEEPEELATVLQNAEIDEIQGYIFSEPRSVEAAGKMFANGSIVKQRINKHLLRISEVA